MLKTVEPIRLNRCRLGRRGLADSRRPKKPCIRWGPRADESIDRREGWQDGDAAFSKFLDHLFILPTTLMLQVEHSIRCVFWAKTVIIELYDLWSRYLANWFIVTWPYVGQTRSLRSHETNGRTLQCAAYRRLSSCLCYSSRCDIASGGFFNSVEMLKNFSPTSAKIPWIFTVCESVGRRCLCHVQA